MGNLRIIWSVAVILTIVSVSGNLVSARPQPLQYFGEGGGVISGYVSGVSNEPVEWANIYADNGQRKFLAVSGVDGLYELRLPPSTYNVSIDVPGYEAVVPTEVTVTNGSVTKMNFNLNTISVSVSSGSSSVINFYLQQTQTPVPEFQSGLSLVFIASMLAVILLIRSRRK